MKKILLGIILGISFISCQNDKSVSMALDWYPNSNHSGIYSAIDEGFFEKENINLEVYTPSDPTAIISSVASGRDDLGLSYHPDILQAQSAGLDAVSYTHLTLPTNREV